MKLILAALSLSLLFTNAQAQESDSKFDLRIGIGSSFLGSGDILAGTLENELNYKINNTFSTSGSLAFGKSKYDRYGAATFFQLNVNIYLSMFPRMIRNDFRIGTGLSYYSVSSARVSIFQLPGESERISYRFEDDNTLGLNVILENTYSISKKLLIGAKAFIQPYINGDINSGLLLKFGVVI